MNILDEISAILEACVQYPLIPVFLVGIFILGFWQVKKRTFKEYALANRDLPVGVVTLSLLATFLSSVLLSGPDIGIRPGYGLVYYLAIGGFTLLAFSLVGLLVAPRLVYFNDCMTMGDVLHKLYGRKVSIVATCINVYFSMLIIRSQMYGMGRFSAHLLGVDEYLVGCLLGAVTVLYTLRGGMRIVAWTDVAQLLLVLVSLLVIAQSLLAKGGVQATWEQVPADLLDFSKARWGKHIKIGFFYMLSLNMVLTEPIVQRCLMMKNPRNNARMLYTGGILMFMIAMLFLVIGLSAVVWCGNRPYSGDYLLAYLTQNLFSSTTVQSFLLIGFLCVMMSTADSYFHATGVVVVKNIIKPVFFPKKRFNQVRWTQYVIFFIGFLIIAAHYFNILFDLGSISIFKSQTWKGEANTAIVRVYVASLVIIPFVLGVMGMKVTPKSFIAFGVSFLVTIPTVMNFTPFNTQAQKFEIWSISVLVATLCFFITHYIQHKGFVTQHRTHHTLGEHHWKFSRQGLVRWAKGLLPTLHNLPQACRQMMERQGSPPTLTFSVFILVFSVGSLVLSAGDVSVIGLIFLVKITWVMGLMLEGIWLPSLKPYFPLYWMGCLMVCTSLTGTLLFLHTPQDLVVSISLAILLFLLSALTDWTSFLALSSVGIGLAYGIHHFFLGHLVAGSIEPTAKLGILMVIVTVVLVGTLFARNKENHALRQMMYGKVIGGSMGHEVNTAIQTEVYGGRVIDRYVGKGQQLEPSKNAAGERGYFLSEKAREELVWVGNRLKDEGEKASQAVKRFTGYLRNNIQGAKMVKASIKSLVQAALQNGLIQQPAVKKLLKTDLKDDFDVLVKVGSVESILDNLVGNARRHAQPSNITITTNAAERTLSVVDNGRGIPPELLPRIFDLFVSTGGDGIGLSLVKLYVEASGATIHCSSKKGETRFVIRFGEVSS